MENSRITRRLVLVLGAIGLIVGLIACGLMLASRSRMKEVGAFISGGRVGVVVAGGEGGDCTPPPAAFRENDLIGVWSAGYEERNDTLILSEAGEYRQRIEVERPSFSYESEPQRWWVEYRNSSPPLLHLEGMRLCVYSLSSHCEKPPAAVDHWYEFCSETILETRNEGVLIILGVPARFEQPLRGLELLPLTKDPDTGGWPYRLEQ